MVATAPEEKLTHRAPTYEELDSLYDINIVFLCRKLHLFLGKSTELHFLTAICTKPFAGWDFTPDPTGGAYSAPPGP